MYRELGYWYLLLFVDTGPNHVASNVIAHKSIPGSSYIIFNFRCLYSGNSYPIGLVFI